MKKIVCLFLFIPIFLFAQTYQRQNIIGNWRIQKCELFSGKELLKSCYLNENNAKVLEGKDMGRMEDDINFMLNTATGANIVFNEDSTVTCDVSVNGVDLTNTYWQLLETGELFFCDRNNRYNIKNALLISKIIGIDGNILYLRIYEYGLELKLTLYK